MLVSIPPAFMDFCRLLIQDINLVAKNEYEAIEFAAEPLSADERESIRQFLSQPELLSMSREELENLWVKTPAEIGFFGDDLRKFLNLVREQI